MKYTLGVDVSHWEGNIDWSVAGQWVPFAYYKCTDGVSGADVSFAANKAGCMAAGMPHAPYHYYQPSIDPGEQAAHFCVTAGEGYKRLIVDLEEAPAERSYFLPNLRKCLEKVQQLSGIVPAIYTSAGFWNEFARPYPTWSKNHDLIVAHYTLEHKPMLPIGWINWVIWQFSDTFWFPGCTETADGNWFNGDLEAARAWFGNYRPVDPPVYNRTRVRSLFGDLRIRHLPSVYSNIVGRLNQGEIVEIENAGGKDVWIKHQRGWSAVERDGHRYMEVLK